MYIVQMFICSLIVSKTYAIMFIMFVIMFLRVLIKYTCVAFPKSRIVFYANTKTILEIMNGLKKKCNCLLQCACNKILIGRFQK